MDFNQRQRLSTMGLSLLKEVALDVLSEAQKNGDGWLTTSNIKGRMTDADYPGWPTCQDILYELEHDGLIDCDTTTKPKRWHIRV